MYTISSAILGIFQNGSKQYARLTFSDTSTIESNRIVQGTFTINRYVATGESIGIGSTVAAELSFVLRNTDAAYASDDLLGEEVFVEIGAMDSNNTIQYVPFGYFTIDDAIENANTINLSALDRMLKFEKTVGTITFPITVNNLLAAACTACSVTLDSSVTGLVNGTYSVTELPDSVKTWREVLQWICEITGTNAWITRDGKLMLSWFATTSSMSLTTANRKDSSVGKDVISLTGVTILSNDTKYTAGTNTRPLIITDNGLISHDHQSVANAINTARNGYSYSSFNATVLPCPHLDPMDVITFVKGSSNILCPVTDITFKLNGMTALGCKSDQTAHGRSYGLQDATFYAHNIAANAVTADKISVDDLAALRATIAGWKIATDALYKDITINGTTYRVSLNAPASPSLTTPAFSVKKRTSSSDPWEEVADILYSGKVISKDFEANGAVHIAPDYDLQESGVYALDLENDSTNERLVANPDFLNIYGAGTTAHMDANHFTTSYDNGSASLTAENYGADYVEFRATQGTAGTSSYREGALSPTEVRVQAHGYQGALTNKATVAADKVKVENSDGSVLSKMEYNIVATQNASKFASMYVAGDGVGFHASDDTSGKESELTATSLEVANHDLLRLTPHLAQMFATNVQVNANLNTPAYCAVGQYYAGTDATVATLSNCPSTEAFNMTVCAPIQTTYDNETSAWVYRVRTIVNMSGEKWVQYCYTSAGGTWNYGGWRKVLTDNPSTYPQTNITSATDVNLSLTSNFGGNWYRKSGNVVEINLSVSGAVDSWRTVTTLPAAYRPAVDRYFSALTLSYGVGAIYVSSAGLLRVRTASGAGTVGGCITYIV